MESQSSQGEASIPEPQGSIVVLEPRKGGLDPGGGKEPWLGLEDLEDKQSKPSIKE